MIPPTKNSDILLSIIIPFYNTPQYIEKCLLSAKYQFTGHKEIILVDDGSDKKSKYVLKNLNHLYDKLITQENMGQSIARNKGISMAKGKYVMVLDSDDYFEADFCTSAVDILKNKNCRLVTCWANRVVNDIKLDIYKPKGGGLNSFLFSNSAMGSAIFKKDDWAEIGGYDQLMRTGWEDWEFYIRLLNLGGVCKVVPQVLLNYRMREGSTTAIANKQKPQLFKYIFKKHKELYSKHYEELVDFLTHLLESEKKERLKLLSKPDYKLGHNLLKLPRSIKRFFK